ncbi:MAG TPA: ATP-binding protein [Thermoanaerobaculia bacterium]|nr:ATP-binding protein [Thermoanaerobaculia bacterium]
MNILRTFRSRLLLGSLFWTAGLLGVSHLLFVLWARFHPHIRFAIYLHAFLVLALLSMIVGLLILRSGLTPFAELRARMNAVRDGREQRIEGEYPGEVQPLIDDLNQLLASRDEAVRRAHERAGDLAHGLKTPLAVLMHEADRAEEEGLAELANAVRQQVERMRRNVDVHLAHARAAGSGATLGAHASAGASAQNLARTLNRLYAERGTRIDVLASENVDVRCQQEDLDEILGNLLDNACKWAASRVAISASVDDSQVRIDVDDDGPGVPAEMRETVLRRGVRADEAAPGSGLGLAIVCDLVEIYGGSLALEASPMGGLRATVRLPRA